MLDFHLSKLLGCNKPSQILALAPINAKLETMSAEVRILWALNNLDGECALSSSFGIQAAMMLHLVIQVKPDILVILIDTGYLFPETYQFVSDMTKHLSLNLRVYRAVQSSSQQEKEYGKLWEQGIEGIQRYNYLNKVEPMRRALNELNISTWFSGLRRDQASSRQTLPILSIQNGIFKFLPVIDWSKKAVNQYLKYNELQYHPLWDEGYVSVGDVHTTSKLKKGMIEEKTRFFGLKRECGLHEDDATGRMEI
ncbi:phosphoadenylyl-sulfate reductase [Candidatus Enterovibrio escicola]|uniref:Phosphoadenosine 5'-phosphosulfate reductase n=1 Tax=Candidatus Enterovibrio escicola TaxID=1927127 RepID=A0A2A5T3M3_9GAMM|nr:phosphoadenylyl-sulfate reductase [Candidatus Enterovibrio escacola]PCS22754.1 Phosphoadenylyl-sulfate reductase [Candidatus Enterovibrio escacola]